MLSETGAAGLPMTGLADLRAAALALPKAIEKPHFERTSFRVDVPKGKIFCTAPDDGTANIFLSIEEQAMLLAAEPDIFSKVPNKWGDKGATCISLTACDAVTLRSALTMAWRRAAPASLHDLS